MTRGQVWHDITYASSKTALTSIPHTDAIPCERCLLIEATPMVRFIREVINTKKSLEEAIQVARGVFDETITNIGDILARIEYVDGEVRYTQ
jgi:hypothetical protein